MVFALALLAGRAAAAAGQTTSTPSLRAVRLPESVPAIRVDGRLDDSAWAAAAPASGFLQREPDMGAPATEDTEIRVVYDHTTLYVGVLARDARPDQVVGRILQRDRLIRGDAFQTGIAWEGDDGIALLFDAFHDHRNAQVFATNPNGAEFDALLTDEGKEFNVDWRGVWRVAAKRTPEGWSAEFAIPFRTLRFPSGGDGTWGFNVARMIRRKNEEVLWSGWSRNDGGFHRVSRAGHLEGLDDLPRSGVNLEAKPYLLTGLTREVPDSGDFVHDQRLEAGVDLKWEVTPGLLLDVTANTDFAQVEVDDEQVNLTRFSLFYPEKRDFFLENAGIFEFGWRQAFEAPPFLLFFSRTIGVAEDGEVPLLGGARLTGRLGRQTIGVMDVFTDEAFGEPKTSNAVVRYKRDVGEANYVGAMLTDRRSSAGWNTAGGVDFSYWPAPSLNVQGFAAGTATDDDEGNGFAGLAVLDWSRDRFRVNVGQLIVSPDATADLGFITRTDVVRTDGLVRLSPRPRALGLRKFDVFGFGQRVGGTDGRLLDWQLGGGIGPDWESGEQATIFATGGSTLIEESFDLEDRVTVPVGKYDQTQLGWFAGSAPGRVIVVGTDGMLQWTYGGRIFAVSGRVTMAPIPNLAFTAGYTRNTVDLPGGAFDADIGSLRITLAASTKLVANALVQYNSLDQTVSSNLRIAFTYRPGSDFYIVYNEQRGDGTDLWASGDRAALFKVTWLQRF
jgi:hypothetical protein